MEMPVGLIAICVNVAVASIIAVLSEILIWNSEKRYVYVSYAKEDKRRVEFAVEVMKKKLRRKWGGRYKVLTSEDIPVGNLMDLTKHCFIKGSKTCIVFLSYNYIEDMNLKNDNELMHHSKVIPVFLDWNDDVSKWSEDIINRKGVFLVGCYSHRIIEYKMKSLTREL